MPLQQRKIEEGGQPCVVLVQRRGSSGLGDGLHIAEEEDVTGDADEQEDASHCEGPEEGLGGVDDVASDDGGSDSGELVAEIEDAADSADAFARSDERRNGPADRRGGGEPTDANRDPEQRSCGGVRVTCTKNPEAKRGAANENDLTDANRVFAALDEGVDEPPADAEIENGSDEPGDAGVERGMQQVDVVGGGEIAGQPGQQEIEAVVVSGEPEAKSPNAALAKEVGEGRALLCTEAIFGLRAAFKDVRALGGGETVVFAGVAVNGVEEGQEEDADEAGAGEIPAPAEMNKHKTEDGNANRGRKFCGGVKRRCGQAAFLARKPVAGSFGVGGECRSFADAEEEARREETAEAGGDCGGEGGDAPNGGAENADATNAEAVEEQAAGELEDGVGPVVGAGEIAEHNGGNAEGVLEGIAGDGEVDAVKIVDEDAEAEEESDSPAAAGDGLGRHAGVWHTEGGRGSCGGT